MKSNISHQTGMTLIEVLISLTIMSFLAIFTASSIRNALSSKTRIQKNIDQQTGLRDALRVMERDINLAFQYRDLNGMLYNKSISEREKRIQQGKKGTQAPAAAPGAQSDFGGPPTDQNEQLQKKPVRVLTQFVGESGALSFSSLGNVRMRADDKTSSVSEIGYALKNCRRRTSQKESSKCLWRRVSPMIGTDVTKGGSETVLLENIKDFSLRYLGPGKDEWVDFWASNERGDDVTKFNFPYAVEITIEITDPNAKDKAKTLRMTQIASIRNPNNPVKQTTAEGVPTDQSVDPSTGLPIDGSDGIDMGEGRDR